MNGAEFSPAHKSRSPSLVSQTMTLAVSAPVTPAADLIVARLPYLPLWAAAQFASRDEVKMLLNTIHIRRDADGITTIESTDGHRLFRYRFPASVGLNFEADAIRNGSLQIDAAPFRKFVSNAHHVEIRFDLLCNVTGGKIKKGLSDSEPHPRALLQAFPATRFGLNSAADTLGTYPNCDQLFPESFNNELGAPWAFNADYLGDFLKVAKKASINNIVRFQGNKPALPFLMDCGFDHAHPSESFRVQDCRMECLIMPVRLCDPIRLRD
jgi:hypothetical protein